jgi:hypothetical protein
MGSRCQTIYVTSLHNHDYLHMHACQWMTSATTNNSTHTNIPVSDRVPQCETPAWATVLQPRTHPHTHDDSPLLPRCALDVSKVYLPGDCCKSRLVTIVGVQATAHHLVGISSSVRRTLVGPCLLDMMVLSSRTYVRGELLRPRETEHIAAVGQQQQGSSGSGPLSTAGCIASEVT